MNYLWVALGAAIGASSRYGLGSLIARRWGTEFPYGTLVINVTGSFLIGVVMTLIVERHLGASPWRPLLVVGVLGGYTTFSSFSYEIMTLIEDGRLTAAFSYIAASVALGLLACYLGMQMTRGLT